MKALKDFLPFLISVILVILFWICFYLFFISNTELSLESKGLTGDSFGVINTLFSGLAFAGIIAALFLQRKDLSLQRDELKLTRKELSKSADAQLKIQESSRMQVLIMSKQALLNSYSSRYNHLEEISPTLSQDAHSIKKRADEMKNLTCKIDKLLQELTLLESKHEIRELEYYNKKPGLK